MIYKAFAAVTLIAAPIVVLTVQSFVPSAPQTAVPSPMAPTPAPVMMPTPAPVVTPAQPCRLRRHRPRRTREISPSASPCQKRAGPFSPPEPDCRPHPHQTPRRSKAYSRRVRRRN